MKGVRLAGHVLWSEGDAIEGRNRYYKTREGRGECECGAQSPVLPSTNQRKQWHRDHKDDIRQGGNGVVWTGDR